MFFGMLEFFEACFVEPEILANMLLLVKSLFVYYGRQLQSFKYEATIQLPIHPENQLILSVWLSLSPLPSPSFPPSPTIYLSISPLIHHLKHSKYSGSSRSQSLTHTQTEPNGTKWY